MDEHFRVLSEKHGDTYSVPQLRLWARTIHCSTHDSYETPPAIPMFGPPPKRPKKESLSETISNAAIAITKAISPSSAVNLPTNQSLVISPGRSVDLRMKNLQQLRFIQQLFDDNILSQEEFLEQKGSILDALRKLN